MSIGIPTFNLSKVQLLRQQVTYTVYVADLNHPFLKGVHILNTEEKTFQLPDGYEIQLAENGKVKYLFDLATKHFHAFFYDYEKQQVYFYKWSDIFPDPLENRIYLTEVAF